MIAEEVSLANRACYFRLGVGVVGRRGPNIMR